MTFDNIPPKWDATGTEPSEELQTRGFLAGYKPPAAYFNYLFNKITACLKELQTKLKTTAETTDTITATRKLHTYISYAEIGLTIGSETIADIAEKLPGNSTLFVSVGADGAGIYPATYGTLYVMKKDGTRTYFEFLEKTAARRYFGVYDSTQTTKWTGWVKFADKNELNEHLNDKDNPHAVTKKQVGLDNVPNVATNDQTPTYSDTNTLATLKSGEKLNVAFQKIKCAITNLITHINTHKLTTLTNLGDIGQTFGAETIEGIANGMPENSELFVSVTSTNAAIYPLQYGLLHVYKNNTSRVFFRFYAKSTAGMWIGVYDSTVTEVWTGWTMVLTKKETVDNLTSTSAELPLSANQGRALGQRVSTLESNKINGGTIDFSSSTLAEIVNFVGTQTGRAFVGRFKLAADHSPNGTNTWFRGVLASQNVANSENDVSVNIIALSGDNVTYTGNIYGLTTFSLRWSKLLRVGDVVDNLASTAGNLPLSANQGRVLSEKINEVGANFTTAAKAIGDAIAAKGVTVPSGASAADMAALITNNLAKKLVSDSGTISIWAGGNATYTGTVVFSAAFSEIPTVGFSWDAARWTSITAENVTRTGFTYKAVCAYHDGDHSSFTWNARN